MRDNWKKERMADLQKMIDNSSSLLPVMRENALSGGLVYQLALKSMESHIEELKSELLSLKEQS